MAYYRSNFSSSWIDGKGCISTRLVIKTTYSMIQLHIRLLMCVWNQTPLLSNRVSVWITIICSIHIFFCYVDRMLFIVSAVFYQLTLFNIIQNWICCTGWSNGILYLIFKYISIWMDSFYKIFQHLILNDTYKLIIIINLIISASNSSQIFVLNTEIKN